MAFRPRLRGAPDRHPRPPFPGDGRARCGTALRKALRTILWSRSGALAGASPALCAPGSAPLRSGPRPGQAIIWLLVILCMLPSAAGAVPAGTVITNTAIADFTVNGSPQTAYSNSVSVTTVLLGSPSALDLFRYAPSSPARYSTRPWARASRCHGHGKALGRPSS